METFFHKRTRFVKIPSDCCSLNGENHTIIGNEMDTIKKGQRKIAENSGDPSYIEGWLVQFVNLSPRRNKQPLFPTRFPAPDIAVRTDLPNSRKERPWTSLTFKEGFVKIWKSSAVKPCNRSPIYLRLILLSLVACFTTRFEILNTRKYLHI